MDKGYGKKKGRELGLTEMVENEKDPELYKALVELTEHILRGDAYMDTYQYEAGKNAYITGTEMMINLLKTHKDRKDVVENLKPKIEVYMSKIEKCNTHLQNQFKHKKKAGYGRPPTEDPVNAFMKGAATAPLSGTKEPKTPGVQNKNPDTQKKPGGMAYSKEMAQIIEESIIDKVINVHWDDIVGIENAKSKLTETIILPAKKPELFQGLRAPTKGILLFGPPGNGKTMIAKAVCGECGDVTFFNVSAGTLTSRYFGDTEKIVRAMFGLAADRQPSVIFIDEIDSVLSARSAEEHEASRRLKTEFLVNFDGVASNEDDKVVFIGATNRPFDLDEAVLRRFTARIYIGLPGSKARETIITKLMQQVKCSLGKQDLKDIVSLTHGYSAADLNAVCREASMEPIRVLNAKELEAMRPEDIKGVVLRDFEKVLKGIQPSVSKKTIAEFKKWNQSHQL